MAVKIRERKLKDENTISLYFDFYINGIRFTKTSNYRIYLDEPKSKQKEKRLNANREGYVLESQYLIQGVNEVRSYEHKSQAIFNDFFWDYSNTRKNKHTRSVWVSVIRIFEEFAGKEVKFKHVDRKFCQAFLDYLLSHNVEVIKSELENAENDAEKTIILKKRSFENSSIITYYAKFQSTIKEGFRQGFLKENYTYNIKDLPKTGSQIVKSEILTIDEVRYLNNHKCNRESLNQVKNMFVFSCQVGLRYSDCFALKWGDISVIDNPCGTEKIYLLNINQQKTGGNLRIPMFQSTVDVLGERKSDDEKVFKLSKHNGTVNKQLRDAFIELGMDSLIKKNITTHKARHTFGVISRNSGVELGTIQKMLGHKNIDSTEIYAKLETSSLISALQKMPQL